MISTNDKKFYNISLAIRSHGWARDVQKSFRLQLEKKYHVDEFKSLYTFYYSGLNVRSTDFNANIGLGQLSKIKKISRTRHKNFLRYQANLGNFWTQQSNLKIVSSFGSYMTDDDGVPYQLIVGLKVPKGPNLLFSSSQE